MLALGLGLDMWFISDSQIILIFKVRLMLALNHNNGTDIGSPVVHRHRSFVLDRTSPRQSSNLVLLPTDLP